MTGQRDQPECAEDSSEREEQRNARRNERPERDHEDQQGDRERELARLSEILAVRRHDGVLGACIAELADEVRGVDLLRDVHAVEDRADVVDGVVGIATDLELDERGVPAGRDLIRILRIERRLDVLHLLECLEPADDVLDHRRERGGVDRD